MRHKLIIAPIVAGVVAGMLGLSAQTAQADSYKVVEGKLPQSLTGKAGDAKSGRDAFKHRQKGNCLACHTLTDMKKEPFHGAVGPSLDGIGANLKADEIRMRIVDPKVINPDTIMPSFFKTKGMHDVTKAFQGKTMLSAQEVEDIVAYLLTLK